MLARLLRTVREKRRLMQVDVAERLDVQQSFVSKVEHGDRMLDLPELHFYAEALGIGIDALVDAYLEALPE